MPSAHLRVAALKARAVAEITNLPILYHRLEGKSMVFEAKSGLLQRPNCEGAQRQPLAWERRNLQFDRWRSLRPKRRASQ
jgi:hypothetical protein